MSELLAATLTALAQQEAESGCEMFLGKPYRWYEVHKLRCINDHVSTRYLKSEERGNLCLACMEPVYLTFPEDKDGPLWGHKLTGGDDGK
jgi:hypothetical protein